MTMQAQASAKHYADNTAWLPDKQQENSIYLTEVLGLLKEKHGLTFFYNPKEVANRSVKDHEALLKLGPEKALLKILQPHRLVYEKVDRKVFVIKTQGKTDKPESQSSQSDPKQPGELTPLEQKMDRLAEVKSKNLLSKKLKAEATALKISGKIVDARTSEGLVGVNVLIKGTEIGVATGLEGLFLLDQVPNNAETLVITYLGYEPLEVPIGDKIFFAISLEPTASNLSEVVVSGYGEQKRRDVTGAISSVKSEDIRNLPQAGVDQLIQGRAAGVVVTQNTGQPGGGVSVRIRGITSLTGSNEPLYVIDGVPIEGNGVNSQAFNVFGGGGGQTAQSALASLNPSDIVSVDILKDASATAIYGSRAANGVIVITTKRGKSNETKISYDTYVGSSEVPKFLDVMKLPEYGKYLNEQQALLGGKPVEELAMTNSLGPGTDWQDAIFRKGMSQSHQLAFSGGNDRNRFYLSGNYFKQDGIVIGSGFDRYSIRANFDSRIRSWLKVGNSLTLSRTNQRITLTDSDDGVVSAALLQAPNIPIRMPDGSWGGPFRDQVSNVDFSFPINPVALAELKDVTQGQNRVLGNVFADITFLKNFTLRTELGGDINFSQNNAFNPTYEWGNNINTVNTFIRTDNQSFFWILKNYLTYNLNVKKHSLNAMAGHEAQRSSWEWLGGQRTGFPSNSLRALNVGNNATATNQNGRGAQSLESYFARAYYGFDNRYQLTITARADGSSKFGPANRWGFFPAAAAAWNISNEKFMEGLEFVSNLKLRIGYGEVGNQNIPNYAYGSALAPWATAYGTGFFVDKIANPTVRWESATQSNIGLDVSLLKDRLSFSVDVYDKISRDFLFQVPVPLFVGAGSNYDQVQAPFLNLGKMENKGIDVTINSVNIEKKNFTWKSSFNLSHYRNELLEIYGGTTAILQRIQWFNDVTISSVGQPVGLFYGWQTAGLFRDVESLKGAAVPDPNKIGSETNPFATYLGDYRFVNNDQTAVNGKQVIDGRDRTVIGNPHPDFVAALTNTFSFKGLDLSIFLTGSKGADIFNFTRRSTEGMNSIGQNQLATVANRYTKDNPNGNLPRAIVGDPNGNTRISDRYIEDGSYLRIQNVAIGYTIPVKANGKTIINSLRVYASAQNLKTFSKYSGYDAELGAFNQNAMIMNVDNGHYPIPRTYTIGMNVEF
jgi:TonB-linked SusC/RagA family outer membrane protein